MMISFRSKLFDTSGADADGIFNGEDLARWMASRLGGWETSVVGEDWGWAVLGAKGPFKYIFGVYDHDTHDVTADGPRWIVRVFNERDRSNWFTKTFIRYVPPKAHDEVVAEVLALLSNASGIADVRTEELT